MRHLLAFAVVAALMGATAVPCYAKGRGGDSQGENDDSQGGGGTSVRSIPEFDPATAGAIGAIVAGGGVLIARRRRR